MLIFLNDISIHQAHNKHFCTKVLSKSYIQQQSKNTTVEIVFKQAPWRRWYACTGSRRLKTNLHIIYVNTIHDVIYRGVEKAQDLTRACRWTITKQTRSICITKVTLLFLHIHDIDITDITHEEHQMILMISIIVGKFWTHRIT